MVRQIFSRERDASAFVNRRVRKGAATTGLGGARGYAWFAPAACAIHCAAGPFVAALAPWLVVGELTERGVMAGSYLIAIAVLAVRRRRGGAAGHDFGGPEAESHSHGGSAHVGCDHPGHSHRDSWLLGSSVLMWLLSLHEWELAVAEPAFGVAGGVLLATVLWRTGRRSTRRATGRSRDGR